MSRNFELLQKLGKDHELLNQTPLPEGASPAGVSHSLRDAASPAPPPSSSSGLQQIEALVQQIFLAPAPDAPRTVVFAGTEDESGSAWVCARTAEMLAGRIGNPICVVDCSLRDPALHSEFSLANEKGLAEALLEAEPIRAYPRQAGLSNLWVVSAGMRAEAAQNLVTSDKMRLRIAELRTEFEFVLLDAAPTTLANHAVGLGAWSDGVVLVLRAQNSRREAARKAMQDFQSAKVKVLGAVLNQNW